MSTQDHTDPVANFEANVQEQRETVIAIVNDLSPVALAELLEMMEEAGVGTFGSV